MSEKEIKIHKKDEIIIPEKQKDENSVLYKRRDGRIILENSYSFPSDTKIVTPEEALIIKIKQKEKK
ncbi:MAG: hypothetical protein ACPKNR_14580 [Pleomorphochaeta sp.]